MKRLGVLLLMLLVGAVCPAMAQKPSVVIRDKPGWYKIGEVQASFKMDTESIVILGMDKFKSIKLKFTDAPVSIERVTVFYEPGETQEIPVNGNFAAGTETGVFDLTKPMDDLKKVSFIYKSEANFKGEKAHVELYGLKE